MNLTATKFNNTTPVYMAEQVQSVPQDKLVEKTEAPADKKDFFSKNKAALSAIGAIALGGIIYAATRGKGNSISPKPKTYVERLNCFGQQITEKLKLDDDGKLVQKLIEHDGIQYCANYKDGKLLEIEGYYPRKLEEFSSGKYTILKELIDENEAPLVVSRKFGQKTNYWLFDKAGENVTQVEEIEVVSDSIYQYGAHKVTKDNSFAYLVEDKFSPKENIPFGEIFECFKKGLL